MRKGLILVTVVFSSPLLTMAQNDDRIEFDPKKSIQEMAAENSHMEVYHWAHSGKQIEEAPFVATSKADEYQNLKGLNIHRIDVDLRLPEGMDVSDTLIKSKAELLFRRNDIEIGKTGHPKFILSLAIRAFREQKDASRIYFRYELAAVAPSYYRASGIWKRTFAEIYTRGNHGTVGTERASDAFKKVFDDDLVIFMNDYLKAQDEFKKVSDKTKVNINAVTTKSSSVSKAEQQRRERARQQAEAKRKAEAAAKLSALKEYEEAWKKTRIKAHPPSPAVPVGREPRLSIDTSGGSGAAYPTYAQYVHIIYEGALRREGKLSGKSGDTCPSYHR